MLPRHKALGHNIIRVEIVSCLIELRRSHSSNPPLQSKVLWNKLLSISMKVYDKDSKKSSRLITIEDLKTIMDSFVCFVICFTCSRHLQRKRKGETN